MMKNSPLKPVTAAIGDGGNDVAMIQVTESFNLMTLILESLRKHMLDLESWGRRAVRRSGQQILPFQSSNFFKKLCWSMGIGTTTGLLCSFTTFSTKMLLALVDNFSMPFTTTFQSKRCTTALT